ncbi:MAG TPA: DUF4380 domain-containing protein [Terriglobia bacterium]
MKTEQATLDIPAGLCNVTAETYLGWNAIRLGNGIVDLVVVPEIGGRIIQLRIGGEEFLYVNPRHLGKVYTPDQNNVRAGWKNYGGSKVWPAPQGWSSDSQWPGPPDPILDGGKYSWEIVETRADEAALALTSAADEYTGLTLRREIRLAADTATIHIQHKIRNSSCRPVRWAAWQVTQQMAGPSLALFAPGRTYRQLLGDDEFSAVQVSDSGIFRLQYKDQVAKFAVKVEEGWICSLDSPRGLAFAERFRIFREADYVDDAPVAFWVNGSGRYTIHSDHVCARDDPNGCDPYVETEVLSPLLNLEPDEEYIFDVQWHCAHAGPANSVERVDHCAVITRDLRVDPEGDCFRVSASFGVFQTGTLELASICRDGRVLDIQPLGPVTPLLPCTVQNRVRADDGLFRLSLRMRNRSGELMGTIASARVDSTAASS